jgi:cytochrome c553
LHSFATICVLSAAVAALLPACSSTDDPVTGGAGASAAGAPAATAGAAGAGTAGAATAGDPTKGSAVYTSQACGSCHGTDAKGSHAPNITFSKTAGIGAWTYQQFSDAMRVGKGADGQMLCLTMSKYTAAEITDPSLQDLYAYLGSLPISDTPLQGDYCP